MIGLLHVAAALEEQQQALVPGRRPRLKHHVNPRSDVGPDLRPHLARRPAERPRIFLAERVAAVRRVTEERQLRAPRHPHGKARGQHDAHDRSEAVRPRLGRADGRALPLDRQQITPYLALRLQGRAQRMIDRRLRRRYVQSALTQPRVSDSELRRRNWCPRSALHISKHRLGWLLQSAIAEIARRSKSRALTASAHRAAGGCRHQCRVGRDSAAARWATTPAAPPERRSARPAPLVRSYFGPLRPRTPFSRGSRNSRLDVGRFVGHAADPPVLLGSAAACA